MPLNISPLDASAGSSGIKGYGTSGDKTEYAIPGFNNGSLDTSGKSQQDAYIPASNNGKQDKATQETQAYQKLGKNTGNNSGNSTVNNLGAKKELSPEEKQIVQDLVRRDQEVKAHEEAHKAAGGGLVSGTTSFDYTTGPDGKQYATGGEVQIDISAVNGDPQATIQKMEQVRRAALAPVDPSAQDRNVAALASSVEAEARLDLMKYTGDTGTNSNNVYNAKAVNSYLQEQSNNKNNEDFFIPGAGSAVLNRVLSNV